MPTDAACFIAVLRIRFFFSSEFSGMFIETNRIALSFKIPLGIPVLGSLPTTPPTGSGVSFVMPEISSATEFASAICPSTLDTNTGFFFVYGSIQFLSGNNPPQFS